MATPLSFDDRLDCAAQLVKRARIFYDIWYFYEGEDTRPLILDTMNLYSEYFRFDVHAHFVSLIVHLAALFEVRQKTINFPGLIQEAEASILVSSAAIHEAKTLLAQAQPLRAKVVILRSNLFAHRSASLAYDETFRKAAITPNQLRDLTELGLTIANVMLRARNSPEQFFHIPSLSDAKKMLNSLRGNNGSDPRDPSAD
jgi:hypothetical protein